jgi:hypothetical protein
LTKATFDEITSRKRNYFEKNKLLFSKNIISQLPFLQSLTSSVKTIVAESLNIVTFSNDVYIVRQGSYGQTFYIILEGTCVVTQENVDSSGNLKVTTLNRLVPGDYFGELALIGSSSPSDVSNKRSANVETVTTTTCLSLSRSEFHALILQGYYLSTNLIYYNSYDYITDPTNRNLFEKRRNAFRKMPNKKGTTNLFENLRRISAYDYTNSKSIVKAEHLFPQFTKFMTESLWCNMYHRLYRSIILNNVLLNEAGSLVTHINAISDNRITFIEKISAALQVIFNNPLSDRTNEEYDLIMAVMNQKNDLKGIIITTTIIHHYYQYML